MAQTMTTLLRPVSLTSMRSGLKQPLTCRTLVGSAILGHVRPGAATAAHTRTPLRARLVCPSSRSPAVPKYTGDVYLSRLDSRAHSSTSSGRNLGAKRTMAQRVKPYLELARYDKPIGTWLLFLPCTFSLTLAAQHLSSSPSQLLACYAIFGTGALVMRGAGCTINDLWDRKLDQGVERTRSRPIASGALTPMNALVFLSGQLSLGLAVLLQLNWYSIFFGATSLALVVVYPLMKRFTHWPQLVLGLAFNWGSLLGYAALGGNLHLPIVLPLYAGTVCWTILYDTVYAHQDAKDDLHTGIKSTALLFGDKTKPILSVFGSAFVGSTAIAMGNTSSGEGHLSTPTTDILVAAKEAWSLPTSSSISDGLSTALTSIDLTAHPAGCAALGAVAAHLYWQIKTVDLTDRADCWAKFRSNRDVGMMLWLGLAIDYAASLVW